jgi:hypothetical protein
MLVVNLVAAWFMNKMDDEGMGHSGCRFLFLWLAVFQALAFGCMFVTYIYWKAHGAEKFVYDPEHPISAKLIERPDEGTPVPADAREAALAGAPQDAALKK